MAFLLKKNKVLLSILMLPYLFILITGTVRTNNELIVVAQITPVVNTVSINNDNNIIQEGSFNTVPVWVIRRPTILQSIYGRWSNNNDVFEISEAQSHLSIAQMNQIGQMNHEDSINTSIILAYREAGAELDYSFEGLRVTFPALNTQLQINDWITQINDIHYTDEVNFINRFNNLEPYDVLHITRNNNNIEITLLYGNDLISNPNYDGSNTQYNRRFNTIKNWNIRPDSELTNPSFHINRSNVQGASGGLMQTLSLLNTLTNDFDYTLGLTIAGTGTINVDGYVGIIGGVRQKVIAAYRSGADIFFIGPDNYEEAKEAFISIGSPSNMSLQLVPQLSDALYYLRNRA